MAKEPDSVFDMDCVRDIASPLSRSGCSFSMDAIFVNKLIPELYDRGREQRV